jgi:uncharacterized protein
MDQSENKLILPGVQAVGRICRGLLESATGITPEIKKRFDEENVCKRCGWCCFSAVRIKGVMVILEDLPCKHLVENENGKKICAVYEERESTGWCWKIGVESIRKELFPPSCGYVQDLPHYKGKILLPPEKFEKTIPILIKIFKGFPKPDYVSAKSWLNFLHKIGAGGALISD